MVKIDMSSQAVVSADFELREREYLKNRKEEEGTNFIQLVSTHCFIPGYFNITCGAFISIIASYASIVLHFLPAKVDCFHSAVLSAASVSQLCNRSKNSRKGRSIFIFM